MSVSEYLQRLQKRGQAPQLSLAQSPNTKATPSVSDTPKPLPNRQVDPVVAKLKALRKAENEKRQAAQISKKLATPGQLKSVSKSPKPAGLAVSRKPSGVRTAKAIHSSQPAHNPPGEKKPKMSFSDLMKKASSIDQSKLLISILPKTKTEASEPASKAAARTKIPLTGKMKIPTSQLLKPKQQPPPRPIRTSAPLPTRQPSAALQSKLSTLKPNRQNKPRRPEFRNGNQSGANDVDEEQEYSEDDDMDSFIEEDGEDHRSRAGYDREEIWAMFSRGRKRTHAHDDYDSDDMEATGAEIFEEEMASKKRALMEDKREMEEERRLAMLKDARKRRAN